MWHSEGTPLGRALSKAFLLPSVLGALPYTLRGGRLTLSCPLVLYSLLLRGGHIFLTVQRSAGGQEFGSLPPQSTYLAKIFIYNTGISAAVSLARNLYNKHKLNYLLSVISKNDSDFRQNGVDVSYKINFAYEAVLYGLVCWPSLLRCLGPNTSCEPWDELHYLLGACLLTSDITAFAHLVELSGARLEGLRRRLQELAAGRHDDRDLAALSRLHLRTRALCAELDRCYSYQLLAVFVTLFLDSLLALSVAILLLLAGRPLDVVLSGGGVIPFYQFLCYSIITKCLRVGEEAKEFNTVLYQLMIDDKTETLASNKKLRLHIQMKREVVFTAYGFFNLDYSLIHSMIAAATTYLVILIQFGETSLPTTPISPIANLSLHSYQANPPPVVLTSPRP